MRANSLGVLRKALRQKVLDVFYPNEAVRSNMIDAATDLNVNSRQMINHISVSANAAPVIHLAVERLEKVCAATEEFLVHITFDNGGWFDPASQKRWLLIAAYNAEADDDLDLASSYRSILTELSFYSKKADAPFLKRVWKAVLS